MQKNMPQLKNLLIDSQSIPKTSPISKKKIPIRMNTPQELISSRTIQMKNSELYIQVTNHHNKSLKLKKLRSKFGQMEMSIGETKVLSPQSKTRDNVDLAGHFLPQVQWKAPGSYLEMFLYPLYPNLNQLIVLKLKEIKDATEV